MKKNLKINEKDLKKFTDNKFEKSPVKFKFLKLNSPSFKEFKSISAEYYIEGSNKIFTKKILNPVENINTKKINLNNFLISEKDKSNLNKKEFIYKVGDEYVVKKGKWIIENDLLIPENKRLIIPSGTEFILINNSKIISKSPIVAKGSFKEKIIFKSFSKTYQNEKDKKFFKKLNFDSNKISQGQCIIILNTQETSIFEHVIFDNLRNCETRLFNSEGSLNVYKSKIKMNYIDFKNNKFGDDGINFVNSSFDLKNIKLENIYSDGIDLDYSDGKIINFSCTNCLNDGIDISNTTLYLENFYASKIDDKALSIGELSTLYGKDIKINNAKIGLAVKDGSTAIIDNLKVEDSKFPITTYIKKKEFGSATLELKKLELLNNSNSVLIEEGTSFIIDNSFIEKITEKNLYKKLYPNAEYRNIL